MLPATRRIKLMLVIPTLDQSGAEKQLTLLACRLAADEFDVHVVALTRGGPFAEVLARHNIRLTVLGKRWKFDPAVLWRLRRLIVSEQPDIVHSWLFAANAYTRLVVGRRMRPRPKLIVSERCVDVWKAGWQLWLDQRLIGRTDRLVGNSQAVADFYQTIGYRPEQVSVIANGVELPDLSMADRTALRAELDLPAEAPVVGFVGRLAKQKRLDDLVFATALLAILRPDVQFLLVGDGPERDALMKFARDINTQDQVRCIGHRSDAARLLAAMDVFWIASDFEGQSNSLMEAMAAGLPVVASDIPPNRELVIDGETGFLVKVGDRVGFQQFADRLLADRDLAQRMGTAGRERMRQHFSIDRMVSQYARLYRELLQ
jgi:glycosyltransferase involved in cell wall biosynthesis